MSDNKEDDTVPAWPKQSTEARLQDCRRMLYFHDMLTDGENDRAYARIVKRYNAKKASP